MTVAAAVVSNRTNLVAARMEKLKVEMSALIAVVDSCLRPLDACRLSAGDDLNQA
jgi:hypothetical protein